MANFRSLGVKADVITEYVYLCHSLSLKLQNIVSLNSLMVVCLHPAMDIEKVRDLLFFFICLIHLYPSFLCSLFPAMNISFRHVFALALPSYLSHPDKWAALHD